MSILQLVIQHLRNIAAQSLTLVEQRLVHWILSSQPADGRQNAVYAGVALGVLGHLQFDDFTRFQARELGVILLTRLRQRPDCMENLRDAENSNSLYSHASMYAEQEYFRTRTF